jgi:hypothetical protein
MKDNPGNLDKYQCAGGDVNCPEKGQGIKTVRWDASRRIYVCDKNEKTCYHTTHLSLIRREERRK